MCVQTEMSEVGQEQITSILETVQVYKVKVGEPVLLPALNTPA